MKYRFYIGVDVSKNTLDVAFLDKDQQEEVSHLKVKNEDTGKAEMISWLRDKKNDFSIDPSLFCTESTGLYCYPLLQFLYQNDASIWMENAIQIKRSLGVVRGKNDKVDAIRIAQYTLKHEERIRLWQPTREVVEKLKHLVALRERLVETRKRLLTPVEEFRHMGNEAIAKILERSMRKSIRAIEADLEEIESQIKEIIDNDDQLRNLFSLVTSVVGIGFVTAVNLIIHTNEFKILNNPRKLACYCGLASFDYSSGSSIKYKRQNPSESYGQ